MSCSVVRSLLLAAEASRCTGIVGRAQPNLCSHGTSPLTTLSLSFSYTSAEASGLLPSLVRLLCALLVIVWVQSPVALPRALPLCERIYVTFEESLRVSNS